MTGRAFPDALPTRYFRPVKIAGGGWLNGLRPVMERSHRRGPPSAREPADVESRVEVLVSKTCSVWPISRTKTSLADDDSCKRG